MSGHPLDAATVKARAQAPYVFGETVDLRGLHVTDPLDLSRCSLTNVDFSGSVFEGPVICASATFRGLAWFKGCTFNRGIDLSRCLFESDLRMDNVICHETLTLTAAECRGAVALDGARITGRARFDHLTAFANLSFTSAVFEADASLRDMQCLGGLWLDGTRFNAARDVRGSEVHGRTWLRDTHGSAAATANDGLVTYGYIYKRANSNH